MPEPELVTLAETDLPELAALCAATLPYDDCSPGLLRTTLLLGTPDEPALPLGLRLAGRLVAVAVGALNASDAGPVGHVKLVATAAETRRRGYTRVASWANWRPASGAAAPGGRSSPSRAATSSPGSTSGTAGRCAASTGSATSGAP